LRLSFDPSNDKNELAPKLLGLRFEVVVAMLIRIRNKYDLFISILGKHLFKKG